MIAIQQPLPDNTQLTMAMVIDGIVDAKSIDPRQQLVLLRRIEKEDGVRSESLRKDLFELFRQEEEEAMEQVQDLTLQDAELAAEEQAELQLPLREEVRQEAERILRETQTEQEREVNLYIGSAEDLKRRRIGEVEGMLMEEEEQKRQAGIDEANRILRGEAPTKNLYRRLRGESDETRSN